jgi:serine/threonine protein kinase
MHTYHTSYLCEKIIGRGRFATVFQARHKIAPVHVAIKSIEQDQINTETDQIRILREISILRQMDHPLIAKLFFVIQEDQNVALVQEYAQHGTLLDLILNQGPIPEDQLRYYFLQLVWILDYLHNVRNVVHCDFKLDNIMLDSYNNIKLIDFDLSYPFTASNHKFTTFCSSPPYLAPELMTNGIYTSAADIWSLGIVLYTLAVGKFPFFNNDFTVLCRQITTNQIHYPMTLSEDLIDLLQQMLCRDPSNRITIEQIKTHPWFPAQQYATIIQTSNTIFHIDIDSDSNNDNDNDNHNDNDNDNDNDSASMSSEVDNDIIALIASYGLDCSELSEAIRAGDENEMTILYNIYVRQKQSEKMNCIFRMSNINNILPHEQR